MQRPLCGLTLLDTVALLLAIAKQIADNHVQIITVVPAFNGHIQAKVSLHGRCPLIGGTGMLEWRAEIRRVRCSHVCHQGATNQQRSPPAAPSPRMLSKPQCACSIVLYGNMQFIELIKWVNYHQCVLLLNVTPCLIVN